MQTTQVSLYYLNHVAELLRSHQCSVEQWLAAEGLTEADLYRSQCLVDVVAYGRLITSAINQAKLPHLGLVVGAHLSINHHGALGFALLNCGDIASMLQIFERYLVTRTPLFGVSLSRGQRYTTVTLTSSVVDERLLRPLTEVLISTLYTTLNSANQRFIGEPTSAIHGVNAIRAMQLSYSPPDYVHKYHELFHLPLAFNASVTQVTIDNSALTHQLRPVDEHSLLQARQFCEQELATVSAHASWQNRVLMQIIATNDCLPTISTVAQQLNLTPRTLHRYLVREGTQFKTILASAHTALAKQYLAEKSSSIKTIAYKLGYSDVANFRRAFKRWTGVTPQAYQLSAHKELNE